MSYYSRLVVELIDWLSWFHFTDDADDGGYFDFRKPNGEVSHSFHSSKFTAIMFS